MARQKAAREHLYLKFGLDGAYGGGKTYTALRLAHLFLHHMPEAESILVIDSQHGQSSKYLGWMEDGIEWNWDVIHVSAPFTTQKLMSALFEATPKDIVILDSMTPFWKDEGGILELANRSGGYPKGWKIATPLWDNIWETILNMPNHVIITMRAKVKNEVGSKIKDDGSTGVSVSTIGLDTAIRNEDPYKLDFLLRMTPENNVGSFIKSHWPPLTGLEFQKPGKEVAEHLMEYVGKDVRWRPNAFQFADYAARMFSGLRMQGSNNVIITPNMDAIKELIGELKLGKYEPQKAQAFLSAFADYFASLQEEKGG